MVWQECTRKIQKLVLEEADGRGFMQQLMERLERDELEEALTMARLIWLKRNSFVFNKDFTPPQKLACLAGKSISQFGMARARAELTDRVSEFQQ